MDDKVLIALAEPNRLKIVELLNDGPHSVNEVATLLKIRQPQASKHLHTLYSVGLVKVYPVAQTRIYALNSEPLLRLGDWLDSFQKDWSLKLNNLEEYLKKGDR